ncbi:hypothetical protein MUK42_33008, partial [Musa troglodytarum]
MDVAEASALAISLILYLSSTQLVRLWCVCGYHLYGAHMMQLVKDALKFLKEEVPLTGYLIVDYFPYRTTSVGLLVAEASTFAIILNCREGKFRIVEKENSDGYAKE